MAVAARTRDPRAVGAITVEMKTSFIGTFMVRRASGGQDDTLPKSS